MKWMIAHVLGGFLGSLPFFTAQAQDLPACLSPDEQAVVLAIHPDTFDFQRTPGAATSNAASVAYQMGAYRELGFAVNYARSHWGQIENDPNFLCQDRTDQTRQALAKIHQHLLELARKPHGERDSVVALLTQGDSHRRETMNRALDALQEAETFTTLYQFQVSFNREAQAPSQECGAAILNQVRSAGLFVPPLGVPGPVPGIPRVPHFSELTNIAVYRLALTKTNPARVDHQSLVCRIYRSRVPYYAGQCVALSRSADLRDFCRGMGQIAVAIQGDPVAPSGPGRRQVPSRRAVISVPVPSGASAPASDAT